MVILSDFEDKKTIKKSVYENVEKDIQERLYLLFSEAHRQGIGTIISIEGFAGSGKGSLMKAITARLDPRKVRVHSVEKDNPVYFEYPALYQFWEKLPAFGELTIFEGSWYRKIVQDRFEGELTNRSFSKHIRSIQNFEDMITDDKYMLFKFFLHISSKEQKKRFKKAKKEGKMWVISDADLKEAKHYKEIRSYYEELIELTHTPDTPWEIIAAKDKYFARIHVMEKLIEALEEKLQFNSAEMLIQLKEKTSREI
jgi:AMP-polyphosphate phosphotransferase